MEFLCAGITDGEQAQLDILEHSIHVATKGSGPLSFDFSYIAERLIYSNGTVYLF